jgi:hypothetical protein
MSAHVRLVSPEDANDDVNVRGSTDSARVQDDEPIGLPEEHVTSRRNVLGYTPPPLVAERENRVAGARSVTVKSKTALAKLFSLAWPPKTKPSTPPAGGETARERRGDALALDKVRLAEDGIDTEENLAPDGAGVVTASNARPPFARRESVLVAAVAGGLVIPAIVLLNWPRSGRPPIVEPGMLADGAKLMAPSAALAMAPPREAPNVSRDRPIVHETRRDELSEMLSFKGVESVPVEASAPANSSIKPTSPPLSAGDKTQALGPMKAASAASDAGRPASGASGPPVQAAAFSSDVSAKSPAAVGPAKPIALTQEMPSPQPPALVASSLSGAVQSAGARPRRDRDDRGAAERSGDGAEPLERSAGAARSRKGRSPYARKDRGTWNAGRSADGASERRSGRGADDLYSRDREIRRYCPSHGARRGKSRSRKRGEGRCCSHFGAMGPLTP